MNRTNTVGGPPGRAEKDERRENQRFLLFGGWLSAFSACLLSLMLVRRRSLALPSIFALRQHCFESGRSRAKDPSFSFPLLHQALKLIDSVRIVINMAFQVVLDAIWRSVFTRFGISLP